MHKKDYPELASRCSHLPQRQQEIALYQRLRKRQPKEDDVETIHDLNCNIEWNSQSIGIAPTIVCTSSLRLRQRMRTIHGAEAMQKCSNAALQQCSNPAMQQCSNAKKEKKRRCICNAFLYRWPLTAISTTTR